MVVDQSKPKCEHENCLCVVPEGQRYCSFHCEQAATQLPASVQAQCGCSPMRNPAAAKITQRHCSVSARTRTKVASESWHFANTHSG